MIEMSSWVLLFWHIFSRILYTLSTQPVLRGMLSMDILVFTFCCIVSQQAVSRYLGSQCFCCMLGSIMHLTNEYLVNVYTMKVNFWKDRLEICKNCSKYTPFGLATDFFFPPYVTSHNCIQKWNNNLGCLTICIRKACHSSWPPIQDVTIAHS